MKEYEIAEVLFLNKKEYWVIRCYNKDNIRIAKRCKTHDEAEEYIKDIEKNFVDLCNRIEKIGDYTEELKKIGTATKEEIKNMDETLKKSAFLKFICKQLEEE